MSTMQDDLPALPIQKASNLKALLKANLHHMETEATHAEYRFTHDLEMDVSTGQFRNPKLVAIQRRAQTDTLRALLAAL